MAKSRAPRSANCVGATIVVAVTVTTTVMLVFFHDAPPVATDGPGESLGRFRTSGASQLGVHPSDANSDVVGPSDTKMSTAKKDGRAAATFNGDESPPPMYEIGNVEGRAIIVGDDRCEEFRRTTSEGRRAAPAGLFNTGTNLFWRLMLRNCAMPRDCAGNLAARRRASDEAAVFEASRSSRRCSPFLTQVAWGKHNPVAWRGSHFAETCRGVNVSEVLPVAIVKDPLTWFKSMCRMEYAAKFRHGHAQCCPSPIASTQTVVRWRRERPASNYASIAHLWSQWNAAYLDLNVPRLVVRYEDLLWRTRETISRVCRCAGGTPADPDDFDLVASSAKGGISHGFADTGRSEATVKYGNETRRYDKLTDDDLDYLLQHLDRRLIETFGYRATAARRRQLLPSSEICRPNRTEYLQSRSRLEPPSVPAPIDK